MKGIKVFLMKKKTKIVNMLMPNIDIFLKKKNKNHQHSWECYQNLPEDEKRKQRLAEYRINYSKMQKIKAG